MGCSTPTAGDLHYVIGISGVILPGLTLKDVTIAIHLSSDGSGTIGGLVGDDVIFLPCVWRSLP